MNNQSKRILQPVRTHWRDVVSAMTRMRADAQVRPGDEWVVFSEVECTEMAFRLELKPVAFHVPERANHGSNNLFIVVKGWLEIDRKAFLDRKMLISHSFATTAAYFRQTRTGLEHIFGVHYDYAANELGHPFFHAQLRSFADHSSYVVDNYEVGNDLEDRVQGLLRTVRVPSAQMDFFSLCIQICADHLLFQGSNREERRAFNELLESTTVLRGAGSQFDRLTSELASSCYRAGNWYPILPDEPVVVRCP